MPQQVPSQVISLIILELPLKILVIIKIVIFQLFQSVMTNTTLHIILDHRPLLLLDTVFLGRMTSFTEVIIQVDQLLPRLKPVTTLFILELVVQLTIR